MDPSVQELQEMKTLADVLEWVGIADDAKRKTKSGLWEAIGSPKLVRHLASIPWTAWCESIARMKIAIHSGEETAPVVTQGNPTAVEMGQVGSVRRISRMLMGVDPSEGVAESSGAAAPPEAAAVAAKVIPPNFILTERKIKISVVMDQGDDSEVKPMDPAAVRRLIAEWRQFENDGEDPHEEQEATGDQLASLDFRLRQGSTPFVDFAVWRPYGARLGRLLKFSASFPLASGGFQTKEINGPANFDDWQKSWRVFVFAMTVLKAASRSKLEKYEARIARLNEQYPGYWWVIGVADIRMRSEHLERIRRRLQRETAAGSTSVSAAAFDAEMPWDATFREAARDEAYWYEHVDKKALLFATQLRTGKELCDEGIGSVVETGGHSLGNNQSLKRRRSPSAASPTRGVNRGKSRKTRDADRKKDSIKTKDQRPPPPRDSSRKRGNKEKHGTKAMRSGKDDGRKFMDSSGSQLCWSWNHTQGGCTSKCPNKRAHACEWCLSTSHRSIACQKKPSGWTP
jgi:hypothetical protein